MIWTHSIVVAETGKVHGTVTNHEVSWIASLATEPTVEKRRYTTTKATRAGVSFSIARRGTTRMGAVQRSNFRA